jgi:hypothetical protein
MIREHDRVVLTVKLPDSGMESGDVGTVVHVYPDGKAFEIEFVTLDGVTKSVVTVDANQVRAVTSHDMTHARDIQIA